MSKIWISTGASQFETNWKNVELKWETLVEKLRKPIVTKESYAEYIEWGNTKEGKEKQGRAKDVGGFVGGIVSGGRRKIGAITARYLVTLDIDFAPDDFWEEFVLEFECEAVLYSTHKHGPGIPRFRLIIPLDREVFADEYEAIARKVAGNLNIEYFDITTFQPERLMFWPSVSKDGQFVFEHQKGPRLNADSILEQYPDWRDSSLWPISEKTKKRIKEGIEKQEDPTAKGGMIGTFCRTYGIEEAIEKFIPHVYEPTAYENKWTYTAGSTAAGMMVYDNLFTFSHHSTDPTQGRLCNAFDLVRIHLFGDQDKDVKEGTPHSKRPSFNSMIDMIVKDELIKQTIIDERFKTGSDKDFGVMAMIDKAAELDEADKEWRKKLDMDKKGNILNTINNVVLILLNDKWLKGNLCFDDLRKASSIKRDLPWRKVSRMSREWTDADDSALRNYLEVLYGIGNRSNIEDALTVVMQQNKFHPVKEYLQSLTWDKIERVERLFIDYLGAEDNPYTREVTKKMMVAAVARVYEPGCKFDNVITLVGPQGIGKSRLIARLGGEWYSDTFGNIATNGAMENIQGVWIMEIGELAGLKKHEQDAIKLFIAKQEDRFRVAYAKKVQSFPRQCIFIGSTNEDTPLNDPTGGRRFWPVKVGVTFKNGRYLDKKDLDQMWAEACYLYTMGEDLFLDEQAEGLAREVQEQHTEQDDRKIGLLNYLETPVPINWQDMPLYDRLSFLSGDESLAKEVELVQREWITIPEIWLEHIRGKQNEMTPYNTKFIRNIMNKIPGWEPKMLNKKPHGYQRGWVRTVNILVTK